MLIRPWKKAVTSTARCDDDGSHHDDDSPFISPSFTRVHCESAAGCEMAVCEDNTGTDGTASATRPAPSLHKASVHHSLVFIASLPLAARWQCVRIIQALMVQLPQLARLHPYIQHQFIIHSCSSRVCRWLRDGSV